MTMKRIIANITERGVQCSSNSLYRYLDFMQEAFMLETVEFYSASEKVRNRNYRKVYCVDWALADAVAPGEGVDPTRQFENMIYVELRRRGHNVSYYRTRKGHEIDFVVTTRSNSALSLIQVAWTLGKPEVLEREIRALHTSAEFLNAEDVLIITNDDETTLTAGSLKIRVLPAWKWLLGKTGK